jgi:hypothetical protein
MSRISGLFLLAIVVLGANQLLAATYAVGTCKPRFPSFTTITAAVTSVPAGSVIDVCPGTYAEQFTISKPLTLQGIATGNAARAVITVPFNVDGAPNLQPNTISQATGVYLGGDFPFAAQILVQTPGPVNLTNLTIDGAGGNFGCFTQPPYVWLAGIFFTNGSSGNVNRVTTRNHLDAGCGSGIWAESAGGSQTVNITNSSLHDFDFSGLFAGTPGYDGSLSLSIKGNSVNGQKEVAQYGAAGINTSFVTAAVSGNTVTGGSVGIFNLSSAPATTISNNTVADATTGIWIDYDFGIAKNNNISNTSTGINLQNNDATATYNTVRKSTTAIEINCSNTNVTVSNNTISDAGTALNDIPGSVASANSYYNVDTIRNQGFCPTKPAGR